MLTFDITLNSLRYIDDEEMRWGTLTQLNGTTGMPSMTLYCVPVAAAQHSQDGFGQVQSTAIGAAGLACAVFRFLKRPPKCKHPSIFCLCVLRVFCLYFQVDCVNLEILVDTVNHQKRRSTMPTVLITGGHSGLGLEAAKQLAAGPKLNLVLAGRSLDKMETSAKLIRSQYRVKVATLKLDLSSLASVRAAAENCRTMLKNGQIDSLQAIICNAGAMFPGPISYSIDGFEETFAGNYLGHFLLVNLLLDALPTSGRIVFTASGTHDPETMDGKMAGGAVEPDAQALALDGKNGVKPISGGKRYATSKLCVILFAYELDRRLRHSQSSLASIAFDPGQIPETGLGRTYPAVVRWLSTTWVVKRILRMLGVTAGSVGFSGAGLARMAMDPAFAERSGKYFQSNDGTISETRSSKMSYDKDRAKKLWTDSAQLVHLQASETPALLQ